MSRVMNLDQHARQLLDALQIRRLCDLDLVVFFARHPRTLLASEQLAGFIGFDLVQIADSLETLLRAGFLKRTAHLSHSARMYVFAPDGPGAAPLSSLVKLVSTRDGRLATRRALARRSADGGARDAEAGPRPTLVRPPAELANDAEPRGLRRGAR
jgi:hypothetical protein